ncbi:MAG: ribonuclease H-like domain-containing protein [Patescibacteria group bacterium]
MQNEIVIDIETKKSFDDVGGKENMKMLGVSCAGAYFYATNTYYAYEEHELPILEKLLLSCDRIIGFNTNHFDLPVLSAYMDWERLKRVPSFDLLQEITKILGHRVSLDSAVSATLGAKKSANGLQALEWFKEGKIAEIKKYCLEDVRLTKELFEYGQKNGKIFYTSYFKTDKLSIPVEWKQTSSMFRPPQSNNFMQGKLL